MNLSVPPEGIVPRSPTGEQHSVHPDWVHQPEVLRAIETSGWPDCSAADVLQALSDIIEKSMEHEPGLQARLLDEYGLTVGELVDMVSKVAAAEPPAQANGATNGGYFAPRKKTDRLASPEAKETVRNLFLRGFTEDQIHGILEPSGISLGQVQDYISSKRMKETGKDVVRLHRDGRTVTEISRTVTLSRAVVYDLLEEAGLAPNKRINVLGQDVRMQIVTLRNSGKTQPEICTALSVTPTQVKNTLRLASKKGLVQDYRQRTAS